MPSAQPQLIPSLDLSEFKWMKAKYYEEGIKSPSYLFPSIPSSTSSYWWERARETCKVSKVPLYCYTHMCLDLMFSFIRFVKVKWKWKSLSHVESLRPHGLYSPWNSPCQNTGLGSLSLLQGIFPTQGSNPGLQHCRRTLYHLSHQGSPILTLRSTAFHLLVGSTTIYQALQPKP